MDIEMGGYYTISENKNDLVQVIKVLGMPVLKNGKEYIAYSIPPLRKIFFMSKDDFLKYAKKKPKWSI